MDVKQLVDSVVEKTTIVIFSKSWCPYCSEAKDLFAQKFPNVPTKIMELDAVDHGSAIQTYLEEKTGQRTVPNIFINKQHVGGCSDLVALDEQNKLADLVNPM